MTGQNEVLLLILMALSSAPATLKKAAARAALIDIDSSTAAVLRESFRQFGIETHPLHDASRLQKEKFDACVIQLNDKAEAYLQEARNSRSNRRIVVFAICGSVAEAIRYSKYGINVLLEYPVDRQNALRAVRSTHLLIINEFRRYVRIPFVVKVEAICGLDHVTGSTAEISGGGMSLHYKGKLKVGDEVQAAFDLPNQPGIKIKGLVCWVRPAESTVGVRFEPSEQPGRDQVKKWIDAYLDIT